MPREIAVQEGTFVEESEPNSERGFSDWQLKAIEMRSSGSSQKDTAEACKKCAKTIRHFLQTPAALKAVQQIRGDRWESLSCRLSELFPTVIDRLESLLQSEDENIILKSASLLRSLLTDSRQFDVERQMADLEGQVQSLIGAPK